jgi:murein DD-endopeptidase / murein LD-carboxypeptidase
MPVDPRRFLGTAFRLQGRDPRYGLDCVGLVALVWDVEAPSDYGLRTTNLQTVMAVLDRLGIRKSEPRPGDAVLYQAGPANLHLGVWMGDSLIHADARLGRVVETPAPVAWPVLGIWQNRQKGTFPWQR